MALRVGCNVFVTTANLPQLDQLAATLAELIDADMCWETAQFLPTLGRGATSGRAPACRSCYPWRARSCS
jgi:hypothetical protein